MSRNDGSFITGLNSAASRRAEEKRKTAAEQKQKLRTAISPQASVIIQWIEKEKADVVNIEKLIINMDSEENVRAQLLAKQMHLDFLNSLKFRAQNILRELPKEPNHE